MSNSTLIAKKAIQEAKRAGKQEMSTRRTNIGIAGSIAEKVTTRTCWVERDGMPMELSIDEQAVRLAGNLTPEELSYIETNWK